MSERWRQWSLYRALFTDLVGLSNTALSYLKLVEGSSQKKKKKKTVGYTTKVQHYRNDLVNNMKDIHEVKDNLPLSFNHVRCSDVADRAGSVHLIYSMDRKLGRKGGTKTHPQQHHPVPQGGPFF